MSFMDIFSRPQKVLPDSDFAYLTTAIVVYQHDEEFAEPGMPDPVVPVLSGRTSEQTTCRDLVARVEQAPVCPWCDRPCCESSAFLVGLSA